MAEAAVSFLLEQVKEVMKGCVDLIAGAENEFDRLQHELGLLKSFLKDAAKKKKKEEHLFRALEARIREVVYEVEDAIDICLTKAMEASAKNDRSRRSSVSSKKKYDLAKEVKSITEKTVLPMFDDAKVMFSRMQAAGGSEFEFDEEDRRSKLKTDKPIRRTGVVGLEDEEERICNYLFQENEERLDVIPIIGIPGLGKTTLTRKIYENDTICFHFPIRIWICISQRFNSRDVFLQILQRFAPSQDMSSLGYNDIVKAATTYLENEKFLLVLDDLWSIEDWEDIKTVLPFKNGKSKVLITSREMAVGRRTSTRGKPHQLRFLTSDESWNLLQYEVFGNLDDCPQELVSTGKMVAAKSDGVPLAIIVIGGILLDQRSKQPTEVAVIKEWETVANNVSNSIKSEGITMIVELSYNRLPYNLRDCFVYLGVFPEDYEIPVNMLLALWIAEGFVQPNDDGKSLEQCAEENLRDLIGRNLLTPEKTNHMGKVKTCRVHDIIRAFCIDINDKEKIFQEIKKSNATEALGENSHGLCIHSDVSGFLSGSPNGPRVRSFLCCDTPQDEQPEYMTNIVDGFRLLRILELKCIIFNSFPAKFVRLIHLRYLTMYVRTLTILPEAITQLWNLQSLIVETESHSITMKANMWRMIRLRYLKTKAAIVLDSKWVDDGGAGDSLHTLSRLFPESCTEEVSKRARNLQTLGISGNLANVFGNKFLENLDRLEKLKLVNTPDDKPLTLPPANCFPPYLKSLTLRSTFLEWQQISALANIPTLEVLKLKNNAFQGTKWNVSGYNFPSLQLLLIDDTDLVIWEASSDSFPKLRFLVLKSCQSLMEIPSCFGMGAYLEKLEVERLSRSAVKSAKAIEESKKRNTSQAKRVVPFILKTGPV